MPNVLDIRPKDVYITIEFGALELKKLHRALESAELNLNLDDEFDKGVDEYTRNEFYPFLSELLSEE